MRVLVAEDEPALARQLQQALQAAGFAVDVAGDGIDAEYLGRELPFDAVVLDLGLPGKDGLSVLRAWRAAGSAVPVLVLTARGSWQEKVLGIDAGADDYLGKPFQMEELVARLRALVRRSSGLASPVLTLGAVRLDTRSCTLEVEGRPVALTAHEYRVLAYLMHQRGRVVARAELSEHLYAQDADRDSNTLDVFIARLRRKLPPGFIATVRGLGWRIDEAAA
ncbi:response regulator transcription factor [uncultured Azohydromonas sp.]|jgi:Response regulators consisting of a CheY-like receiver domain and a winged-helix DNA-binding domain|uniref:response regulator transcription factor n=1 Tax=uncultured Azohydromonas sp. TaxID=487342 RepID=UPI00261BB626|nr:response regulator transcription factor [uncultured Azohydromonas sp.]